MCADCVTDAVCKEEEKIYEEGGKEEKEDEDEEEGWKDGREMRRKGQRAAPPQETNVPAPDVVYDL